MALAIDWAFCCHALLGDLRSIRCGAAFTATNLRLRNSEGLGPRAWTTLCGVVARHGFSFAIATFNLPLKGDEVVAFAFTPCTPGTFAWFWATRQFASSLIHGSMSDAHRRCGTKHVGLAFASTWRIFHCDSVIAVLLASRTTFHAIWTSTTIGAFGPVLPVALAISLAWFCAARMDFLSAACLGASFAAMSGLPGDAVHTFLDSTTTSCRTRTVLAPTPVTINWAWPNVACTLFFISVTMRTIKATFVSVDKAVFTSLQATTALGGALSPSAPLSTDMFLGHFIAWLLLWHFVLWFLNRWRGVE